MSRIGKVPVFIPDAVSVLVTDHCVEVRGPKGVLVKPAFANVNLVVGADKVDVSPIGDSKHSRAMWGTVRSILSNMVYGVNYGFVQELEINGVGYRAAVKGQYLNLSLGKSHNTKIIIPSDVKVDIPKQGIMIIECIDRERLGQFVSLIINQRPPEPYKGKGIKRKGQFVQKKEGKKN